MQTSEARVTPRSPNHTWAPLAVLTLSAIACAILVPQPEELEPTPLPEATRISTPLSEQPGHTTPPAAPGATPTGELQPGTQSTARDLRARLAQVQRWFYYLDFNPEQDIYQRMAASTYDMVVIEPIVTEQENTDFPIAEMVSLLHQAPHPKLVIAYVDVAQAEEWRTYWEDDWEIGDPDWIVAEDPDGWEGNYPVAYWRDEWREIWLGEAGYLQLLLEAGFDGIYLDWVEAYSDENVIAAAEEENVDPVEEIKRWVSDLAAYTRARQPDFLVIAQNAAELAEHDDYRETIDAIAQEQVWFDGGAEDDPPGDCPLPRTEQEVESDEYVESLSPSCRRVYEDYPESTLHVSSEWYLDYLTLARDKGVLIFTVDYATQPENVAWVYTTSRGLGFLPFVSVRNLDIYLDPVP